MAQHIASSPQCMKQLLAQVMYRTAEMAGRKELPDALNRRRLVSPFLRSSEETSSDSFAKESRAERSRRKKGNF